MKYYKLHSDYSDSHYRIRIMECVIIVELILIAVFNFWPKSKESQPFQVSNQPEVTTIIEAPVRTRQAGQPPSPPSPQVPVEVPDEVIIDNKDIEFLKFSDLGKKDSLGLSIGNTGGSPGKIYKNPEQAPSIVYIVEPTIENKTDKKALIYISFLVDKKGNVEEATIKRILLFDDEGNPTIEVKEISERVLSATVDAALQWRFRPAKVNSQPVKALTVSTFTVDY